MKYTRVLKKKPWNHNFFIFFSLFVLYLEQGGVIDVISTDSFRYRDFKFIKMTELLKLIEESHVIVIT